MALQRLLYVVTATGAAYQASSVDADDVKFSTFTVAKTAKNAGDALATTGAYTAALDANTNDIIDARVLTFKSGVGVTDGGNGAYVIDGGGLRIRNIGTPTQGGDATTKTYVDNLAMGVDWKASVRCIITGNVATTAPGAGPHDGVSPAYGDRVLLIGQTATQENGIWIFGVSGAAAMTRPTDFTGSGTVSGGTSVFVEEGTTYADTGWIITTNGAITVGTTPHAWTQFTGLGRVTVSGSGIVMNGNQLSLDADLEAISQLGFTASALLRKTAANTWTLDTSTYLTSASAVTTFSAGTTGLTPISATSGAVTLGGTLIIGNGGTGATTATAAFDNLAPTTTVGDTIYHNGTDNVRLAGNITTTRQFKAQTGNGARSAAPVWTALATTDIPEHFLGTTSIAFNRASAAQTLNGVSIDGSAASVANALTINNGGAGVASGSTFNGSAAVTISYNTIGAAASGHNHTGVYIAIAGNVSQANLDTLTGGGSTTLHTHTGLVAASAPEVSFDTNATVTGLVANTGGITGGDAVYILDATHVAKADCAATGSNYIASRVIGLAKATATAGSTVQVITRGVLTGLSVSGMTAGDQIFLSTAGSLTRDAAGLASRSRTIQVGIALSATVLLVDIRDLGMKA